MALTITAQGSATSTTSSTTLAGSTWSSSWLDGDLIVVCIAADNAGGGGASSISSVTDGNSNTYTQRQIQNNDPTTASSGITVAIYTAISKGTLANGTSITVNFGNNTTSKAMYAYKVDTASTEFAKYVTAGGAVASTANPSITTGTITSGDAVIAALASEGNTQPTADADTSNGSWSTAIDTTANTGTVLTSVNLHTQYKITTGTAAQTWNQTFAAQDWAHAYIVVSPAAIISRTVTNSGTGTASANRLVKRLRTATNTGTGTQSATRVITKLRTGTNSATGTQSATGLVTPQITRHERTGSGSGTGTQSATRLVTDFKTASGTGAGSAAVLSGKKLFRTASGSGVGSGSITSGRKVSRSATGIGSSIRFYTYTAAVDYDNPELLYLAYQPSATWDLKVRFNRTASGSGTSSAELSSHKIVSRTATGTGAERTASYKYDEPVLYNITADYLGTLLDAQWYVQDVFWATGSGTGSSTAIVRGNIKVTATGTGTGSQSAILGARVREASGSGIGSHTIQTRKWLFRQSTSAGTSTFAIISGRVIKTTATGQGVSIVYSLYNNTVDYDDIIIKYNGTQPSAIGIVFQIRLASGSGVGDGTAIHPDILTDGYWGQLI